MRAALLQMTSSDDPAQNLATMRGMLARARDEGAQIALTPEVCNCVSMDRGHQAEVLRPEDADEGLSGLRAAAAELGIWVLAGSLALKAEPPETRFVNRSFLISPEGEIAARYDKMHMFDVQVSEAETYRESSGYAPGGRAVLADTPLGTFGLSICYDVRFAYLYRALAQAGAQVLTVPAAFSPGTGPMHWQPLLQARAIETGCYVLAPAQTGQHAATAGRSRRTYGHSMVISPWGEVLLDAGTDPGVFCVDLDMGAVEEARRKVPALSHDRQFEGPA
ncbi:Predicted amidohydrolase [Mameliella alba]|uniref:carbon-nitrogen hydrolase family protein n=1 Tax=Mameliella alba TaxID=561184 RepID=UPI00087EE590|nr:carbon-nitrogen hydrolase family protein [Mameliella alba]OWV46905.1 amidohydrolase [Mameliella alba]PTR38085.1 putative amidohydrolase [Mameliella alba]GGF68144.1 amidohydrolase [Mameliella alba]SDD57949.1 Predicted amidohydrolase [Mameliella alba]